jgi:hypothetical protein
MSRKIIVLGDPSTHGGQVVTAWGRDGPVPMTVGGLPVACVGDRVACARGTAAAPSSKARQPRRWLAGRSRSKAARQAAARRSSRRASPPPRRARQITARQR